MGVKAEILFVNKLFISISLLVTGVLSDLIFSSKPFFLKSYETFPERIKVSIKLLTIFSASDEFIFF